MTDAEFLIREAEIIEQGLCIAINQRAIKMRAIASRLTPPEPSVGEADERMKKLWEGALEMIAHLPGCNVRYYTQNQECNCGYFEVRQKIRDVLKAAQLADKLKEQQ